MPRNFVRTAIAVVLAHAACMATAPMAVAATPTAAALEISIGGIGPGVDASAFKTIKFLLGLAVFDGTIDYFAVSGYGKEGGFSACVQQGRFAQPGSFEQLAYSLRRIKPNPSTTAYSVTPVAQCPTLEPAAALPSVSATTSDQNSRKLSQ